MSKKSVIGIVFSCFVLVLVSGLYTNCQPIGEGFEYANLNSDDSNGSGVDPKDDGTPTPGSTVANGQALWVNSLEPMLQTSCNSCHALPFQGGTAPLTIYNYDLMKSLAMPGPTASDNPFMNKVKGIVAHGGGNICPGDVNGSVTPCKEIKEWVLAEFPLLTDGKAGAVTGTTLQGSVRGWVADPANFAVPVDVVFYIDGPVGVGTEIGRQLANLNGIGATNGKYFNFQIPAVYNDGVVRQLYIYAVTPNVAVTVDDLIPNMPVQTQSFTPQPLNSLARNVYENELRPRLNQCMGCHQVDYSVHWFQVGNATPLAGGTANNNELINYMNGQNGHSGGSYCGGNKNNEPCASVQRWWVAEFQQ